MGTRAINPLERGDIELIESWVAQKKDQLYREYSKFNQEDYNIDDEDQDKFIFLDDIYDDGEYFNQWELQLNKLLEERLIDVETLQDFLILLIYVKPENEEESHAFEEIKSRIEKKIEGVEKR